MYIGIKILSIIIELDDQSSKMFMTLEGRSRFAVTISEAQSYVVNVKNRKFRSDVSREET